MLCGCLPVAPPRFVADHAGVLTYEPALNRDLDLAILLVSQLMATVTAADASPLGIRLNSSSTARWPAPAASTSASAPGRGRRTGRRRRVRRAIRRRILAAAARLLPSRVAGALPLALWSAQSGSPSPPTAGRPGLRRGHPQDSEPCQSRLARRSGPRSGGHLPVRLVPPDLRRR
jgi:hypothetical protein